MYGRTVGWAPKWSAVPFDPGIDGDDPVPKNAGQGPSQ